MNFLNTFRGRLLLILLFMLAATIGVQYFLNYRTQQQSNDLRQLQNRALVAAIAMGSNSLTSNEDRVADLVDRSSQTILDPETKGLIKDIIIIDNQWRVTDSLNPDYLPVTGENGEVIYKNLADLKDLPPLMEGRRLGEDLQHFPNARTEEN